MTIDLDLAAIQNFAIAILIGALIGIEREKRKAAESDAASGGLRTFILIALVGAVAGRLSTALAMPWLLVAAVVAVAALVLSGYVLAARPGGPAGLGITTEVAGVVVCLLGAMTTTGHRDVAVALAIATTAVLAYKQPLHGLVERIGWDDLFAGVRLLIATFIVLPLLPDRTVDPWGALNPYALWLLVLLISSLSLVGYVATRWVGPDRGAALTGLTGGLVSSTAVTLSFARESRDDAHRAGGPALAGGVLLAWCVMFVRVVVAVAIVNRSLVGRLAPAFLAMAAVAGGSAWLCYRKSRAARSAVAERAHAVPLRNPFSLRQASRFAAFFALVLLLVKLVERQRAVGGLYAVAALAGLTDVDAITLSMATYAVDGDPRLAVNAIVIAALTNTMVKCAMAAGLGGPAMRRPVLLATGVLLAVGVGAMVMG